MNWSIFLELLHQKDIDSQISCVEGVGEASEQPGKDGNTPDTRGQGPPGYQCKPDLSCWSFLPTTLQEKSSKLKK